jgi:hypothetical protein
MKPDPNLPTSPSGAGRPLEDAVSQLRRGAGALLRQAAGVARELGQHDELVYGENTGNLIGDGGTYALHYLGRRRFAHDFDTFFATSAHSFRNQPNVLNFLISRSGLQKCPPDADLLVVDQYLLPQRLCSAPSTYAPFLNAYLPVESTLEAQLARIRSKGHRRKLSAVLKGPLSWRKTQDRKDFDHWYTQMYQPFVQLRFGDDGTVVDRESMAKVLAKRGFLLLLEEAGVPVSGAMMYTSRSRPNSLNYWKYAFIDAASLSPNAFGERNAKTEAMVLSHTVESAYAELDFGLTRACPVDGIFVHKKRIGCSFRLPEAAACFALHFAPNAQPRLLSRYPMVVQTTAGMEAWLGLCGELDFVAARRLRDSLSACGFGALGQVHLFCQDVHTSRDKLEGLLAAEAAELGCPVRVHGL